MDEFRADLHCHTTFSDGSYTPTELLKEAKRVGIQAIAITDHDTTGAYRQALTIAPSYSIELLPGIELSSIERREPVHILGYAFNENDEGLQRFCLAHQRRRKERNRAIIERLKNLKLPIEEEDFPINSGSVGRPHIAYAMVKRGYVDSIQRAFKLYLKEGGLAYVEGDHFSAEETIEVIHRAGGVAVIAHPHLITDQAVVDYMLTLPIDGLEAYYCYYPKSKCERWLRIAKKKDLLITGGSDFHGSVKKIALGASWTERATFELLRQHYQKTIDALPKSD